MVLSHHKHHDTDVVQNYLDKLSNLGRPAVRVGKPDSVAAQGDNAASHDKTDSQGAAAGKPKGGRGRLGINWQYKGCSEARQRQANVDHLPFTFLWQKPGCVCC